MKRVALALLLAFGSLPASGCWSKNKFFFDDRAEKAHFDQVATQVEYPDAESTTGQETLGTAPPYLLNPEKPPVYWDIALDDAIQSALQRNRTIRDVQGRIINTPTAIQTVFDPAIVETNPRAGVEAALSAFDAQFTSRVLWDRNERPTNTRTGILYQQFQVPNLSQDLGTFQSELSKVTASGGTFYARHNVRYEWNNLPSRKYPSVWEPDFEMEFRQPLLQGSGIDFNRIAGPNSQPGVYNGVMLARINTDVSLADFEFAVRNLMSDTETAYWELYFSYRDFRAALAARDAALESWRNIRQRWKAGARGGSAEEEARAREQYFLLQSQLENILSGSLYERERRLRFLMGLPAADGRLIRPKDEPTTARVLFDWSEILPESLTRRVELRRQKWIIKRRELELVAARNFRLPRLDALARYRWHGFGDELITDDPGDLKSAYRTLFGGDYQEWELGWQFQMQIGQRLGLNAIRNAQLLLTRDRAVLGDQELLVTHDLSSSIARLDRTYALTHSTFNRAVASRQQLDAVTKEYEAGKQPLNFVLDAQRRTFEAQANYYRSLVDYNLAIQNVHFQKGSLLDYHGVALAEGPWPAKAYRDAVHNVRHYQRPEVDYALHRSPAVSRGPFPQQTLARPEQVTPVEPAEDLPPPATEPAPQPAESAPPPMAEDET